MENKRRLGEALFLSELANQQLRWAVEDMFKEKDYHCGLSRITGAMADLHLVTVNISNVIESGGTVGKPRKPRRYKDY